MGGLVFTWEGGKEGGRGGPGRQQFAKNPENQPANVKFYFLKHGGGKGKECCSQNDVGLNQSKIQRGQYFDHLLVFDILCRPRQFDHNSSQHQEAVQL